MKLISFLILVLFSFKPNPKRQIITDDYNFDFYILLDNKEKYHPQKTYTWYKNGVLHTSVGAVNGYVLDGKYTKSYVSGAIAEQGEFKEGLKNGVWISWYSSGKKKSVENWKRGFLNGEKKVFSDSGDITIKGRYKNGFKKGIWVHSITKDTLFYKKGKLINRKKLKNSKAPRVNFYEYLKKFFKPKKTAVKKKRVAKTKSKNNK